MSVSSEDYLHWTTPTNAPVDCISGYTIQWSGSSIFIPNNATNVSVSTLISGSNNHLPFCVEVPTLVIPSVPIVPESPLNVTQNDPPVSLVYQDPGNGLIDDALALILGISVEFVRYMNNSYYRISVTEHHFEREWQRGYRI